MALRSVAGKLRALLPRRAPPCRPDAFDLEELADFHHWDTQDIARKMEQEARLLYEESQKNMRKNYRNAWLAAVTTVGFSATAAISVCKAFKELGEPELDKLKVEPKGKSSVHNTRAT